METALKNQIRRLKNRVKKLEKLSSRISTFRLFDVVLGLVVVYFAAQIGNLWLFLVILALGIASFIALVNWHRKIDDAIERFSGWVKIREAHLARMNLNWNEIPHTEQQKTYDNHPFAKDLDIVDEHSLLQLINTGLHSGGIERLETWLLNRNTDLSELTRRQELVKELKPMAHFRDRLHLNAAIARKNRKEHDWEMDDLLLWVRSTQQNGFKVPLLILFALSFINIALFILFLAEILATYVIFTFLAYVLTYNYYSKLSSGTVDEAQQIEKLLMQFRPVLQFLENFRYKRDSRLKEFCNIFHKGSQRPSIYLKRNIRIASAASSKSSDVVWFVLNVIGPWDLFFAKKLSDYKSDLEPKLTKWLDCFYKLEALDSLANFAWLNDEYIFSLPSPQKRSGIITAKNLGHPLIRKSKKVTNDVTIESSGDILLITGSNMSGKSTFLRTLGINLCLCFSGAPVNARAFQTIPFRIFSSINVTDSLDEGLSHFYAEVKRLRELLDELDEEDVYPLFYMVDEIYRGTNNRERLRGSEAFLKKVAGKNGVGLISTHDLELARLEDEIETLSNWHFEETIEDGKMRFEYKLKPGPCPTTNALKIMKMEGLPV